MKKTYKNKIIDFGDYLRKKVDKKDDEELGELPTIEVNDENMYDMYTLLDHFFAQQHKKLTK
ncbi:hypothetical protein DWV75_14390 [Ruminococcus sp. AF12-5]|nr:hypothetical protein DWV75_14390 [Ruminococcus sp. AF12-5]